MSSCPSKLSTVQAIAVQTLRGAANKEVVDAFEGRILALSKAHSLLGRKHWETDRSTNPSSLIVPTLIAFRGSGLVLRIAPSRLGSGTTNLTLCDHR
jgi:two-component sensor histidine kinase